MGKGQGAAMSSSAPKSVKVKYTGASSSAGKNKNAEGVSIGAVLLRLACLKVHHLRVFKGA